MPEKDLPLGDNGESVPYDIKSVAHLKSLYKGFPTVIDRDIAICGIVRSNDSAHNFYKTLIIEDDSGGIEIRLDDEKLFVRFTVGYPVVVRCNSLVLGSYGGLVQLGTPSYDPKHQVAVIPADEIGQYVRRTTTTEQNMTPTLLNIDELSARYLNCYIVIPEVQFIEEEIGLNWCESELYTTRHIVNPKGDTLQVYNRPQALFAGKEITEKSGVMIGILSFFNGRYQLRVNYPYNYWMSSPRFNVEQNEEP